MSATVRGRHSWSLDREGDSGHRTYNIDWLVQATDASDGPQTIMGAAGLASIGSIWTYGNDSDAWAFCTPYMRVRRHDSREDQPGYWWLVSQQFSTRPRTRCQDESIEDPLLEPDDISGTFVKYLEEKMKDKDGNPILTSSHELVRGPQVEFDSNRPTVRISQNVASLGLSTFTEMVDTVNDATLWGLEKRKIKLSNVSWERLLYGTCDYYYKRAFDFDINFKTFDRDVVDQGTKALGYWYVNEVTGINEWVTAGDANDPKDFNRYQDKHGNYTTVLLNGSGAPLSSGADPVTFEVAYYEESNFEELGIPTSL